MNRRAHRIVYWGLMMGLLGSPAVLAGTNGCLPGNRVTFNHLAGRIELPNPDKPDDATLPAAKLCLHDGEAFVVEFTHTEPTLFRYGISVLEGPKLKAGGQMLQPGTAESTAIGRTSITWQHDRAFSLYQVSVLVGPESVETAADPEAAAELQKASESLGRLEEKLDAWPEQTLKEFQALESQVQSIRGPLAEAQRRLVQGDDSEAKKVAVKNLGSVDAALRNLAGGSQKAAAQREVAGATKALENARDVLRVTLHSYTFPVWVETIGWDTSFTGGFVFSNLTSDDYYIRTDKKNNNDDADDVVTVERADRSADEFRPDVIALASFTYKRPTVNDWGLSFGIGLDDQANPRYYMGAHYALGRFVRLTGGAAGGQVDVLRAGWRTHQAPPDPDATVVPVDGRFRVGVFVGLGFSIAEREKEFTASLAVAQESGTQK